MQHIDFPRCTLLLASKGNLRKPASRFWKNLGHTLTIAPTLYGARLRLTWNKTGETVHIDNHNNIRYQRLRQLVRESEAFARQWRCW
jgi:hypothetical protein